MPIGQVPLVVPAGFTYEQAIQRVENGTLQGVSIYPESIGTGVAENYGIIELLTYENPEPIPILLLASGYFGASLSITWTGRITLEPALAVRGVIWANTTNVAFRMNIFTEVP